MPQELAGDQFEDLRKPLSLHLQRVVIPQTGQDRTGNDQQQHKDIGGTHAWSPSARLVLEINVESPGGTGGLSASETVIRRTLAGEPPVPAIPDHHCNP